MKNDRRSEAMRLGLRVMLAALVSMSLSGLCLSQVVHVNGREYEKSGQKWYKYDEGKRGFEIAPERLVVRMRDRGKPENTDFKAKGFSKAKVLPGEILGGYHVVEIGPSFDPPSALATIAGDSRYEYVDFDGYAEYHGDPHDQYYTSQWNLGKVSMPAAWNLTRGNKKVVLAIIDSGVDYLHEDLDGSLWLNEIEAGGTLGIDDDNNGYLDDFIGWDFLEYDNTPVDDYGHGTNVAGIAIAQTDNSEGGTFKGVAGVAGPWGNQSGVKLMVLRNSVLGDWSFISTAMQGITYAVTNGASVINMSFGWHPGLYYPTEVIDLATNNYNCVLVASAGNANTQVYSPANHPSVIAVGATIQDDSRWYVNANAGSNFGPELDLMAPGGAQIIYTTDTRGAAGFVSGDYNCCFSGTSAAAPHVAGAAALVRSINPTLSWAQVGDILRNSADKVPGMGGAGFTNEYGNGRLNVQAAVDAAGYTTSSSDVDVGWNMVSVPLLLSDFARSAVYPTAQQVQVYNGGYQEASTIQNGVGYFAQFPTDDPIPYSGYLVTPMIAPVATNWNIIGSFGWNLPTSDVIPSPGVSVLTSYYEYDGGYVPTDVLMPGEGYWVKVSSSGSLELDITPDRPPTPSLPHAQPPVLVAPPNGSQVNVTDPTPTLSWTTSSGATSYRVVISRWTDILDPLEDRTTTQTSIDVIGPLEIDVTYYWHVAAVNANGQGAFSMPFHFTYVDEAPDEDPPPPCEGSSSFQSMDHFTVGDRHQVKQVLYARNTAQENRLPFSDFELPPPLPGKFDARFPGDKLIAEITPDGELREIPIVFKNPHGPLEFSWSVNRANGVHYWIADKARPGQKIPLKGSGRLYLNAGSDSSFTVFASGADPCDPSQTTVKFTDLRSGEAEILPTTLWLGQNYPNPFNPSTVIRYDLPEDGFVKITVFNSLGQTVSTPVNGFETAGYRTALFDGTNLPAGVYFYRIQFGATSYTNKMVLTK